MVKKGSLRDARTTSAHMLEYLRYDIPAMRQYACEGRSRGEDIFSATGRAGGNGRARAGAERGEREARDATFEEAARARRVARAASASTASSPRVRSRRTPRRGDDPFPVRAAGAGCQPGCDFRRAARRARRVRDGGGGARTAELAAADISLANGRS